MTLRNKRILITAGPTWVPVDRVRVISNIASGETGILLAQQLSKIGAKATLLLGPVAISSINKKIKIVNFKFFDELKTKVIRELRSKKYDAVIHSAAVSDYGPEKTYSQKLNSGKKIWQLNLAPLPKIIDLIKKERPSLFLVGFKFEPSKNKNSLFKNTRKLVNRLNLDLAVANTIKNGRYCAYILNHDKIYGPFGSRFTLTKELINLISNKI